MQKLADALNQQAQIYLMLEERIAIPKEKLAILRMGKEIANRALGTIAQMDRIVVLEDGRIAEQGSHGALLAQNGLYARFWARQSGGFIGLDA